MTIESTEQYRQALLEYAWTLFFWGFWDYTDISDAEAIRREFEQRLDYCRNTLLDLDQWVTKSGVRLVHVNDTPKAVSPAGIRSPIKTDQVRQFEAQLRDIFDLNETAQATTMWPAAELPNVQIPSEDVRRQLQAAIQEMFDSILTPSKDVAD